MSSDNVGHTVSMITAMPLQLVSSDNRACHSFRTKELHLTSSAIVVLHAVIGISHLDGLRLGLGLRPMQVVGGFISV